MYSKYEARITQNADGAFYAYIVRIERDGEEFVINTYKSRHFSSLKAAEKSTSAHIARFT